MVNTGVIFSGRKENVNMKKINLSKLGIGKKELMLFALVLALGAAIYLNWQFSPVPIDTPTSADAQENSGLGVAELVNSQYLEYVTDEQPSDNNTAASVLSQARIDRQNSRDEAIGLLEDILSDSNTDAETKQQAVNEASVIARNMLEESDIESILRAKGIEDVVVCISSDSCSVMVTDVQDYSLIIQEAVMSQTDFTPDSINIIEAN